jgi:hypothetical protein
MRNLARFIATAFLVLVLCSFGPNKAQGDQGEGGNSGGGSCFLPGTLITMADGAMKNIEDVKVGDKTLSYDEGAGRDIEGVVEELESRARDHHYVMETDNGTVVKLTDEHPLYTRQGWKSINPANTLRYDNMKVGALAVGDELLRSDGSWTAVKSMKYVKGDVRTYNLKKVSSTNTYYANGLLAHNMAGGNGGGGAASWLPIMNIPHFTGGVWELADGKVERTEGVYPLNHGLLWMDFLDDTKTTLETIGFFDYDVKGDDGQRYNLNGRKRQCKFVDDSTIVWTDENGEWRFHFDSDESLLMTIKDKTVVYSAAFQRVYSDSSNPFAGKWIAVKGSSSGMPLKNGKIVIFDTKAGVVIAGNLYYERNKSAWFEKSIGYLKKRLNSQTKISWSEERNFTLDGVLTSMKSHFTVELLSSDELSVKVSNRASHATAIFKRMY